MCFSAGASFAGGAVISALGVASIRNARNPSQKLFAGIPLLFAFQQFSEGVVWLTLKTTGQYQLQMSATYIFLMMALVVWPTMIPLAIKRLEENSKRRKILTGLLVAGAVLSGYYAFCLVSFSVRPVINEFHIQYLGDFPASLSNLAFAIYLVATITPLFVSTVKRMYLLGIFIMFSCIVTGIFYKEYLTSVWCFFAALISGGIYWIVKESQEETDQSGVRLMETI
jgi:Family of unknown function (DUF6629)